MDSIEVLTGDIINSSKIEDKNLPVNEKNRNAMSDKKIFNFTVCELMEILKEFPKDMPVIVSGYETGYENFYHPFVIKIKHLPQNMYWDGEFQNDDNGIDVLIIERNVRND